MVCVKMRAKQVFVEKKFLFYFRTRSYCVLNEEVAQYP
jgi:hypothetical protein